MKINDFPFSDFLKNAWRFTFRNRLLWIIGLFVGSGGFFVNFNFQDWFNQVGAGTGAAVSFNVFLENAKNVFSGALPIVLILSGFFLLIFIMFLVSLIARGGMLSAIAREKSGEQSKFWSLIKMGYEKMGTFLVVEIILGAINLVFLGIFVLALFSFDNIIVKILVAIAIVAMIAYGIFISLFKHYVYCYAILESKTSWDSIKAGFALLKKNFWVMVMAKLIEIGLYIGIGICLIVASAILLLPIALLGVVMVFIFGVTAMVVAAIVAVLVLVVFVLALRGAASTYFQQFFTQVYWKITE